MFARTSQLHPYAVCIAKCGVVCDVWMSMDAIIS